MKIIKLEDKTVIELSDNEAEKLKDEIEFIEHLEGLINPLGGNDGSPLLREIWNSMIALFGGDKLC